MSTQAEVPQLGTLTPAEFRQKLAGLLDPQEQISPQSREHIRALAIEFAGSLPELFGDSLDRTTLWDRIGSGLQAAFAKTAGEDFEFFIAAALDHIRASAAAAARNDALASVMMVLDGWSPTERQAWITYFSTHLVPVLVHARAAWERTKKDRKENATDRPFGGTHE